MIGRGYPTGIDSVSAGLRRREFSSVAHISAVLHACQTAQPSLGAFTEILSEEALALARDRDRALGAGEKLGPLHGVPIGVKDIFDWPGRRCTYGSALRQARRPARAAPVLGRLLAAGAIPVGFLNMSEFAMGPTGHNRTYGDCRNPKDVSRIPGGSSSGSGAAMAAGLISAALGSDTGGSSRIPASCCGIAGMKPTQSRIDRRGMLPLSPSLDCVGLLAERASDCMTLYRCCNTGLTKARPRRHSPGPRLAVALPMLRSAERDVERAFSAAMDLLEGAGAHLVDVVPPPFELLDQLADKIQRPEALSVHCHRLQRHADLFTPAVRARIERGFSVPPAERRHALRKRGSLQRGFVANLGSCEALLLPTLPICVPTLRETDEAAGRTELAPLLALWTRWTNYLDLPAISISCGSDGNGMPVGLQLVGPPGTDLPLLELATWIESISGWPPAAARIPSSRRAAPCSI